MFFACTPELSYDQTMRLLMVKSLRHWEIDKGHVFRAIHDVHAALLFQNAMALCNHFKQPVDKQIFFRGFDQTIKIFTDVIRWVGKDQIDTFGGIFLSSVNASPG